MIEIQYRLISDYPGYRVGDDGTVWSCKDSSGKQTTTWKKLKPRIGSHNYPYVNLCKNGVGKSFCVHALVLTAFAGKCPDGCECCHGPGGPHDASRTNLRWGTPTANAHDKELFGTVAHGEAHPQSKLSPQAVIDIRLRYAAGGIFQRELASQYGVNQSVISEAIARKTWRRA